MIHLFHECFSERVASCLSPPVIADLHLCATPRSPNDHKRGRDPAARYGLDRGDLHLFYKHHRQLATVAIGQDVSVNVLFVYARFAQSVVETS